MKWIGLTGGMGTGKSTVAGIIQRLGYNVINADLIAHKVLEPTSPAFAKIVDFFGTDILGSDKKIDRKKLGSIVFSDKYKLSKLEAMTHPVIQTMAKNEKIRLESQGVDMAFYDVPLLYEKRLQKSFDKIIVVFCKKETQFQRAQERTGLSLDEVRKRIAQQIPIEQKVSAADYTIRNDGTLEELHMNVQTLLLDLKKDLKLV